MKLYEIPNESTVLCKVSDGSSWITFHHIDGMYSLCTTERGAICHLYAVAEVVALGDGTFRLREEDE